MKKVKLDKDEISRQINKIEEKWKQRLTETWVSDMRNGACCYGKPISNNTIRIYVNGIRRFFKHLKQNLSNIKEATVKAIEEYDADQYSSRKNLRDAVISFVKFLISRGVING
jgi:site-specific recombinase XerD